MQLETAVSIKDKEQNLLIEQLRNEVAVSNARENDVKKSHALEASQRCRWLWVLCFIDVNPNPRDQTINGQQFVED